MDRQTVICNSRATFATEKIQWNEIFKLFSFFSDYTPNRNVLIQVLHNSSEFELIDPKEEPDYEDM